MFASLLALVPLVMAFVSIMTTFLLLLGLTELTAVSPIVQFLIALIGLGVAIDYSLLVVSRWREERSHGRSGDEAVQRAMETAGRAVVFSGVTVAIGLRALIVLPCRSCGAWATAACFSRSSRPSWRSRSPRRAGDVGPRLDWPRLRHRDKVSRAWERWARPSAAAVAGGRARRWR